ncbi:MAG: hypothetical protein ACE1ZA_05730 [Pseudomonadales bacterium]
MPIGTAAFLDFQPGSILTGPVSWPNTGTGGASFDLDTVVGTSSDITRVLDGPTGNLTVVNSNASNNDDAALKTTANVTITATQFTFVVFAEFAAPVHGLFGGIFDTRTGISGRKVLFHTPVSDTNLWRVGTGNNPWTEQRYITGRVAFGGRFDSVGNLIDFRMTNELGQGVDMRNESVAVSADFVNFGTILNLNSQAAPIVGAMGEFRMWDSKLSDADYDTVFNDIFNKWVNPALVRLLPENILTGGFWDNDLEASGGAPYDMDTKVGTAATITRTTDSVTGFNLCTGGTAADCTLKSTVTNLIIPDPWTFVMFCIFDRDDFDVVGGSPTFLDARDTGDNSSREFLFFSLGGNQIQLGRQGGSPHTGQASVFGRQVLAGRFHNGVSDLQDFYVSGGVDQRNWLSGTPQGRALEWVNLFRNVQNQNPAALSFGEIVVWDSLLDDQVYLAEIRRMQAKWKAKVAGKNLMSLMY